MSKYNLYCFDLMGACVCRDEFDAENNAEARAMAGAICDACADEHHSHELWKGDLPIGSGETLAGAPNAGLSPKARKSVLNHMIALSHSAWPVGRSHRMCERIAAWTRDLESIPAGTDEQSAMRQFRRGIEFFVRSPDDMHWTWTANLKTRQGERLEGTVVGTRAVAMKLCIAAIDEALSGDAASQTHDARSEAVGRILRQAHLAVPPEAGQVLLAEDEALFCDAAAAFLKTAGFEVFQAGDGEEALMILKEHPQISLLISDMRMPHMDGCALVEACLGIKPDLKVILMTGYANTPTKFVQERNIDTLRKPFDLNVLRRRVETLATVH